MIDYDNLPAEIERLHDEAEDLVSLSHNVEDLEHSADLKAQARKLITKAAALRAQIEAS